MRSKTLLTLFLFFSMFANAADEPLKYASSIKSVKVYRSGAEVVHQSSVSLSEGVHEVIIQGISNKIDINSIRINAPSTLTVMRVEFGTDFLVVPGSASSVKKLQDSISVIGTELDRVKQDITTIQELLEVLKSNRDIKGSQQNLEVAELMKLMEYYKAKSAELYRDLGVANQKQKKLQEIITKLRNQVKEEETKNTKQAGQLHLQFSAAVAGKFPLEIMYLTPNAHWTPYYDLRVDNIRQPMKLIYRAQVSQTTGIDWKKVQLSLSSSVPSQHSNAPQLKQWFLSYIDPHKLLNSLQGRAAGLAVASKLEEVVVVGYSSATASDQYQEAEMLYVVNGNVMSRDEFRKISPAAIKSKEIIKGDAATSIYGSRASGGATVVTLKDGLEDYVSVTDKELDISFDIELPYDVPANGKPQTANLQEYSVPSDFRFYAAPGIEKESYLLAQVSAWEKLNLLPGNANIILEGTFIGKSFIDPTSISDTLNLTIGKDKRVAIRKDLLQDYSSSRLLGSTRIQKITYEITVKNNKKDTVKMELKDQFPVSSNREIEVELLESSGADVSNETGIMTWDIELKPGESRKIRYAFSVRYPKDRQINLR